MQTASTTPAQKSKNAAATDCGNSRNGFRFTDRVVAAAQRLWPRKTAAELAVRSKSGVRACEYWLARKTEISGEALTELLRSDAGLEVLEAIIGDARPVWWRQFAKTIELSRLRKAQDDTRRRLEALELNL